MPVFKSASDNTCSCSFSVSVTLLSFPSVAPAESENVSWGFYCKCFFSSSSPFLLNFSPVVSFERRFIPIIPPALSRVPRCQCKKDNLIRRSAVNTNTVVWRIINCKFLANKEENISSMIIQEIVKLGWARGVGHVFLTRHISVLACLSVCVLSVLGFAKLQVSRSSESFAFIWEMRISKTDGLS